MIASEPSPPDAEESYELGPEWRPSKNLWIRFRERIRGNLPLQVGLVLLGGFLAIGVSSVIRFGNHLEVLKDDPSLTSTLSPPGPSAMHPFGTIGGISPPAGFDILVALL
ncbi:MAG: hypothetical protein L3J73_05415, partial [Thermoplasmata archaeon]|nr:hypothetical protein [Thermoplasmata archaeon]